MLKSKDINFCEGPFLKKIILFSLPIIFAGLLQILFTAADIAVLGHFSGDNAISAVSSTTSIITLLVNVSMGLGNGASVVAAQNLGAKNKDAVEKVVHSAILLALLLGVFFGVLGFSLTRPVLVAMKSPTEIINLSALYLKIYFCGFPFLLIYNFGAAILRAVGDTTRPLVYLTVSGVLNVILNIIFVTALNMNVAGVALATILSQLVSAVLVILHMLKLENDCRLYLSKLRINKQALSRILYIGLPAGLQGVIFSASNMLMQSSINSLGTIAMAAKAAAANITDCVYTPMNAIHHASTTFIGQNTGAKKYQQIRKLTRLLLLTVTVIGISLSALVILLHKPLLSIFTKSPEVQSNALIYLLMLCVPYFLCGCMDVMVGCIRGMGNSVQPMLVSVFGVCVLRFVWILAIFPLKREFGFLLASYGITWLITFILQLIIYKRTLNRLEK